MDIKQGMNRIHDIPSARSSDPAFELMVKLYQEKVFRFIALYVSNRQDCEELVSDVFLSLWNIRHKINQIENPDSYIFTTAKNKALNYLKRAKAVFSDLEDIPIDLFHHTTTTPESIYINNETIDALNDVINELPAKTKLAFLLIREDKMRYKDAATVLGVTPKTIEKQVASAVAKLKEKLSKMDL